MEEDANDHSDEISMKMVSDPGTYIQLTTIFA